MRFTGATVSLVSVVIPAYNLADWIAETIGSVLHQTYQDLELIIVDDGSTDRTAEIAESVLRKGKLRFEILQQENKGPSVARNRGWRAASGKWIQFLDADDLIHPQKIETQITQNRHAGSAVIYSDWQHLYWKDGFWQKADYVVKPVIGQNVLADLL